MKTEAGDVFNTPAFSEMMKGYADEQAAERFEWEMNNQHRDWENYEDEPCPKCNGFGKNPQHPEDPFCVACEGTGVWFRITYGHQDGHAYAYVKEYGLDFVKEYCKLMREAHAERQLAGKVSDSFGVKPFAMTKFLEMELTARGFTPDQFYGGKEGVEIAKFVARNYPDFMCVNYTNF